MLQAVEAKGKLTSGSTLGAELGDTADRVVLVKSWGSEAEQSGAVLFRVESGAVEQNRVLTLPVVHPASCGSKGEACQWGMLQEQSWAALSMVWC